METHTTRFRAGVTTSYHRWIQLVVAILTMYGSLRIVSY
jgi:hypothetical protein